jgi:hypothetical protein
MGDFPAAAMGLAAPCCMNEEKDCVGTDRLSFPPASIASDAKILPGSSRSPGKALSTIGYSQLLCEAVVKVSGAFLQKLKDRASFTTASMFLVFLRFGEAIAWQPKSKGLILEITQIRFFVMDRLAGAIPALARMAIVQNYFSRVSANRRHVGYHAACPWPLRPLELQFALANRSPKLAKQNPH